MSMTDLAAVLTQGGARPRTSRRNPTPRRAQFDFSGNSVPKATTAPVKGGAQ
jgi:hypothetical protein